MRKLKNLAILAIGFSFVVACSRERSSVTGWDYNNSKTGGFQKVPFIDQETGPGLLFVEGGTFTMGRAEQDVMFDNNNRPRRVTVSSFYMDQTEVSNFHWLEYLYWIGRTYESFPQVYSNALPDTLCWRSPLGFNEKYVDYYLRYPSYRDYPVVGVSWLQASDFCKWRTDRVNEYILVREGVLKFDPGQIDDGAFNSETYIAGQHTGVDERKVLDLDPTGPGVQGKKLGERIIKLEDGMLLPRYRLPTEAEWEFAAYGLIGNLSNAEVISDRKIYPWTGHWVRQDDAQFQGAIRANFVRGRGDYMGVAGSLNDAGDVTREVDSYWPNDYGLYNMGGNVNEWVMDVYRAMSHEEFDEFRPFRGNSFTTRVLNQAGSTDTKNAQVMYDVHGMKEYLHEYERIRFQRITASNHNPLDSTISQGIKGPVGSRNPESALYLQPDNIYVSKGNVKDSVELALLQRINYWVDSAIAFKNLRFDNEASALIKAEIFDGIFADQLREGPDFEYAFEVITHLRAGFNEYVIDTPGKLKYRPVTEEENIGRLNYRKDDYVDYLDGDIESSIYYSSAEDKNKVNKNSRDPKLMMYQSEHEEVGPDGSVLKASGKNSWPTTLVSDKSRVYKGGAWNDRAYWLVASTRRFLDEDQSLSSLGFRCAMDRLGSPQSLAKAKKKKKK